MQIIEDILQECLTQLPHSMKVYSYGALDVFWA